MTLIEDARVDMGMGVVVLVRFLVTGIALLQGFLAVVTWNRRREAPEARSFALLVALMAVYSFGYAGELAQRTLDGAVGWLNVEYLAMPWAGALWVMAACRHNGMRVRTSLLFVIPVITEIGYFTNFHHWFYTVPPVLVARGPFLVLELVRGPLSILDNAYLLICFLAGSWVYLMGLRNASAIYRRQGTVLLLSSLLPFLGYFSYLANLSAWGLDWTPVTLGVTCLLLYYGIFHCGMFDLRPVARTLIFNSIRDAVLILDTQERLLDFNPAARKLLPVLSGAGLGEQVSRLLADTPVVVKALTGTEESAEFRTVTDGRERSFEVRTWPLFSGQGARAGGEGGEAGLGRRVGKAAIFADVTAQVELREQLRHGAETDPLTGIANRRRFHLAMEVECLRCGRSHAPLSVLMIDLDNFKTVNDQYGHPAGDAVLKLLALRLLDSLRKTDMLARYGGEEFAVLLPETPMAGAMVIAERIRVSIERTPARVEGREIPLSVSVGVSNHSREGEGNAEVLIKEADLALYRAKTMGRNRVEG